MLTKAQSDLKLRAYRESDRADVVRLLSFLPRLYPGGLMWLDNRLGEALRAEARCTVACRSDKIVGLTIETPKNGRAIKLSTIFVDPEFRSYGIGRMLIATCYEQWKRDLVERSYVTADYRIANLLGKLLAQFSFEKTELVKNRYGQGRHEVVFSWYKNKDAHFERKEVGT